MKKTITFFMTMAIAVFTLIGCQKPTPPLVANFTYSFDPVTLGLVHFTNTSTNATSYSWYFGDGNYIGSTLTSPSYTYAAPGTYIITLNAHGDNIGSSVNSTNQTIIISSSNNNNNNNGNGNGNGGLVPGGKVYVYRGTPNPAYPYLSVSFSGSGGSNISDDHVVYSDYLGQQPVTYTATEWTQPAASVGNGQASGRHWSGGSFIVISTAQDVILP